MKVKLYVTHTQNRQFFKSKLPTLTKDYCYISRKVTIVNDPTNVYQHGEYGYVTVNGRILFVKSDNFGDPSHWEITI
jgi:hypothetical protein